MCSLYSGCALCEVDEDGNVLLSEGTAEALGLGQDHTDLLLSKHEQDACLVGYDRDYLQQMQTRTERLRLADEGAGRSEAAHFARSRRLFGLVEAAPRAGSAIRISPAMRQLGRIERLALVVGAGDRFEIWNPDLAAAIDDPGLRELARHRLRAHRRHAPRPGSRRAPTRGGGR